MPCDLVLHFQVLHFPVLHFQRPHRRQYSWLSINNVLDVRTTSATIHCAVYNTYGDASVNLSQPEERSGKSEAELALDVLYY